MADNDSDLSPLATLGAQESLAVKSVLKATLDRELAEEASMTGATISGAATPQHTASPGRLTPAATRARRSPRGRT